MKMKNSSFSPLPDRSDSTKPNAGKPHRFLTHTGKDGDLGDIWCHNNIYLTRKGIEAFHWKMASFLGVSDIEVVLEYESDGASERKYSYEHGNRKTRTKIHMVDRHGENGDASFYDEDCLERRSSYKDDESDPCFSLCINYTRSHFPSAMKEVVSPKVYINSMGCVLLSFPVLSRLMHLVLNEEA